MPRKAEVGYRKDNNQVALGNTGKPGNDHNQKIHALRCQNEPHPTGGICGNLYGTNGSDI